MHVGGGEGAEARCCKREERVVTVYYCSDGCGPKREGGILIDVNWTCACSKNPATVSLLNDAPANLIPWTLTPPPPHAQATPSNGGATILGAMDFVVPLGCSGRGVFTVV